MPILDIEIVGNIEDSRKANLARRFDGVPAAVFLVVFYGEPVVYIIFAGLGVSLIFQGLIAFEVINFFRPNWEKRIVEKKLGRKL